MPNSGSPTHPLRAKTRFGYATIAGLPNAGKSTLVNALVGEKVAIVADKPQTTRGAVQGIRTTPEGQIVFVDTPGIHRGDSYFNRRMMSAVREALDAPDVRVYLTDAAREPGAAEWEALDTVARAHREAPRPAILALNKIDLIRDKREILPRIERFREKFAFDEFVPVSATTGAGLDDLAATILRLLPEGEPQFPPDRFTDQPEKYLAAELIREQVLRVTRAEVPHSVAVQVEEWEEKKTLTRIAARIAVEREGQKGILIGARGATLKRIGTEARQAIESMVGRKVFLELRVTVEPRWRDSERFVNELDWRTNA
ncbi:MAG: GTPase Era [Bryobacteraceae bacterium]|nr:GTPase Era [Bryobacteraceae bacterium]